MDWVKMDWAVDVNRVKSKLYYGRPILLIRRDLVAAGWSGTKAHFIIRAAQFLLGDI